MMENYLLDALPPSVIVFIGLSCPNTNLASSLLSARFSDIEDRHDLYCVVERVLAQYLGCQ